MKNRLLCFCFFFCGRLVLPAQSLSQGSVNVTLNTFDHTVIDHNKVKLEWSTASETNNKEFFVFRSIDRENWYVVGIIPARSHGGVKHYEMVDFTASGGINYYKLQASDGSEMRQELAKLQVELEDLSIAVKILVNREKGQIVLESAEQLFTIELDLSDMIQRRFPLSFVRDNSNQITIVIPGLDQGIYYLRCFINGKRYVRKKAAFI